MRYLKTLVPSEQTIPFKYFIEGKLKSKTKLQKTFKF